MKHTIPNIALGAWSWGVGNAGGDQVFGNHFTAEDIKPVFDKAMELGLYLWDTAAVYGEGSSERILGSFLKERVREDFIISTKFTPQIASSSEAAMQEMLNGSKQRLHTEVIDLYWIHNPMDIEKWTPQLLPLLKSKQVLSVGVSNHNLAQIKRVNEILGAEGYAISALQNHYSLLHRSSESAGILKYCKEHSISFYAYMVLEQGALTGRFHSGHPFPEGSDRANIYNPMLVTLEPLLSLLKSIGKTHKASAAQIAIAWAIQKGVLPIIGVTKVSQVLEAKQATEIALTKEEMQSLEERSEQIEISTLREWEKDMESTIERKGEPS